MTPITRKIFNRKNNGNDNQKYERPHRTTLEILDNTNTNNIIVDDLLSQDYERIKKMIVQGFKDIDTKNEHGHTALHVACLKGDIERVKLLIECGAGLNVKDNKGNTVLFLAIKKANVEIVELLLKTNKIDLKVKNFDDLTPVEYAKEISDDETPLLWDRKNKLLEIIGLLNQ